MQRNIEAHGIKCLNPAVTGFKVCQMHGAGSPHKGKAGGRPITHGRYSTLKNENLKALIEKFEADPNPLDILPEIATARALFSDYIDRYEVITGSLIAWHKSFQSSESERTPKPVRILDIADVEKILGTISKMADRVQRQQNAFAISRSELARILQEMSRVIILNIEDRELLGKIRDGWAGIRL